MHLLAAVQPTPVMGVGQQACSAGSTASGKPYPHGTENESENASENRSRRESKSKSENESDYETMAFGIHTVESYQTLYAIRLLRIR